MKFNREIALLSIFLSFCLTSPASGSNNLSADDSKDPDKIVKVSTLILTDSIKLADKKKPQSISQKEFEFQEQFKFLNNGLPSNLRTGENIGDQFQLETVVVDDAHQTEALRRICFPDRREGGRSKLLGEVIGFLAPKLIGLFVKEVDKGLEKEIAKYSVTHKKKVAVRPYAAGDNFELSSPCFRYSRFEEKQFDEVLKEVDGVKTIKRTSKRDLTFDFIGQWKIVEGQHIRMRPLRLYVRSSNVPKDSKKIALAISAKAEAVWKNDNEGRSGEIFNTVILTENLKKPKGEKISWTNGLKFYNLTKNKEIKKIDANGKEVGERIIQLDSDGAPVKVIRGELNSDASWSDFAALPIIPYSKDNEPDTAYATLEISVAEVGSGAKKKILKLAKKGLNAFEDDITSVLEEAASNYLEDEAPVIDTPEKYCATFSSILTEDGAIEGSAEWTSGNVECD